MNIRKVIIGGLVAVGAAVVSYKNYKKQQEKQEPIEVEAIVEPSEEK